MINMNNNLKQTQPKVYGSRAPPQHQRGEKKHETQTMRVI